MSNSLNPQSPASSPREQAWPSWTALPVQLTEATLSWRSDQQFIAMLNAFRASGGLSRAEGLAVMFRACASTELTTLAENIIKRKVVSLEWQAKIWLPLFQFNLVDMTLRPAVSEALLELVTVYDDWDVAHWFSLPNPWLADGTPADTLLSDAPAVLNAARAERYVLAS